MLEGTANIAILRHLDKGRDRRAGPLHLPFVHGIEKVCADSSEDGNLPGFDDDRLPFDPPSDAATPPPPFDTPSKTTPSPLMVIKMPNKDIPKLSSPLFYLAMVFLALLLLLPTAFGDGDAKCAKLTTNYSDQAVDVDGDGLYDLLVVEAEVMVSAPGEYSLMGFLYTQEGEEVVWSIDHGIFEPGLHNMILEFDGKTIERSGHDGPYLLKKVVLSSGSAESGQTICEYVATAYRTQAYNFSDFSYLSPSEKIISGTGRGELLVTFTIRDQIPVTSGRYSYDIVDINIPPISTPLTVKASKTGYSFDLPGIFMPNKPNNFTVTAEGVKNLNIGLKKPQGERIRTWVTTQVQAGDDGQATAETDLISPGSYHAKIFGDVAEDATFVDLTMTMEKKLIIDGKFSLAIDTTGFPSGDYSIKAKAVSGSFALDEISLGGLSMGEEK
ncbi:hypothetical protein [Candidatus Methanocrinis natronophilus]|uniref:DUF3821 domain-containing protein n=1 Tax=Candidatus Methanocrinis natronophilus TaxID=3033396 RepID=A0ABT5XB33_9EURY|nr:hypothetical protein [Candidatus Methanocrinis natronophilus]MDF0591931.1 hypothetical protein [Candidatus Methanocrinis natronophilus]